MVTAQADAPADWEEINAESRPTSWGPATTVNDAIAGWRLNGWDDLSPTTSRRYEVIWRLHVKDTIGRRRIAELTPWDFERYFRTLKAQGQSQASVRYARAMLHRACRLAPEVERRGTPEPGGGHGDARVALRRASGAGPGTQR
jgi:hypothetical protein